MKNKTCRAESCFCRRLTALTLVMCIVFSLFTAVPVSAAESKIVVYSHNTIGYDYTSLTGGTDGVDYGVEINGLRGFGAFTLDSSSSSEASYTYTDINGNEATYNFTKSWKAGQGNTTKRCLYFTPESECKVTVVFMGSEENRSMTIYQSEDASVTQAGTGAAVGFSLEVTDTTKPVYVYGGSSNKFLYAIIVEYYNANDSQTTPSPSVDIEIGDYIQMGTYYGEPILWRCVAFEKITGYDQNGNPIVDSTDTVTEYTNGYLPLMVSDKIICLKAFDAKTNLNEETGSHSRDAQGYRGWSGSNYWGDSNIRSWLNSDESLGSVEWACGNPPDADSVSYNEYDQESGFLSNFTQSELDAVQTVTQKSIVSYSEYANDVYIAGNDAYQFGWWYSEFGMDDLMNSYENAYSMYLSDSMFLMDVCQVYNLYKNASVLGDEYYLAKRADSCLITDEYTSSSVGGDSYYQYWLRTPRTAHEGWYGGAVFYESYVDTDKMVKTDKVANDGEVGIRPAFYLDNLNTSFVKGIGTAESPFLIGENPTDESHMPADINNITINGRGTAYGRFAIKNVDGSVAKNKIICYSVDGGMEEITTTDKYGHVCIEIPEITESKKYNVSFFGNGIEPLNGVLNVTVTPLHFKSNYEASFTKGGKIGVSMGVGGSIGNLGAEAELASVGLSGSSKKGLMVSQEHIGNKNKLTVTAKQNYDAAVDAKLGLFAGVDLSELASVEATVGDWHGKGSYGRFAGVSFVDDDFDIEDENDIKDFSKFMLSAMIENMDSNVATRYILEKIIDTPTNSYEKGSTALLSAGASFGAIEVSAGNVAGEVTIAGLDGESLWTNSTTTMPDDSKKYLSSVTSSTSMKLFNVEPKYKMQCIETEGVDIFNTEYIDDISLSASEDTYGNLKEMGITMQDSINNSILWNEYTENESETILYKDNAAENIVSAYEPLSRFAKGEKGFFSLSQINEVAGIFTASDESGEYSATSEYKKGIDLGLSAEFEAGIDVGVNAGVSGIQSYEFESLNGLYEKNCVYVQAKNDIKDEVEEQFWGIEDLFQMVKEDICSIINGLWDTVSGKIDEAGTAVVEAGNAVISGAGDFFVSITKPKADVNTMAVLAIEDEVSLFSTSSVTTTIGEPYIVEIEDSEGVPVVDLSQNPLTIAITYTAEDLSEVGVNDVNGISMLRWDDDKCVYVNVGGELDAENMCVKNEITKNGQYILAIDNCSPAITKFMASDTGKEPKIAAIVSDMSGISDFGFAIDDTILIDKQNVDNYYDATTGLFEYQTTELSEGEHTATLFVSDTFGNEIQEVILFSVSKVSPEIITVSELSDTVQSGDLVTATVAGDNLSEVFLNVKAVDMYGREIHTSIVMNENDGTYNAEIPKMTAGSEISVWVNAYNTSGNNAQSKVQNSMVVVMNDFAEVTTAESETAKDGRGNPAKGWLAEFVQNDSNAQPTKLIWNISSTSGETKLNPEQSITTTLSGGATVRYGLIITGTVEQLDSITVEAVLE